MDIIAAIATAAGKGGIAVVRISGDGALGIAKAMFSRKGEYRPNMLYTGTIDCGDFRDFGMCVYFRAPRSFTGEDVVEFHCHGGMRIAHGVLNRALASGARLAEAGEFTKRAYLNGKLSLSAVEGMGEMISAEVSAQVRAGYLLYGEALTAAVKPLQDKLKRCLAGVDADVDYPEEGLSDDLRGEVLSSLSEIVGTLSALLAKYRTGKKIKAGVNVVLCGRPNAGKSSLFNALLGYDRAIVSSAAGTTRDILEGDLEYRGILFRLTDTAGLRESGDEVEREGVRRAERAILSADVIVCLYPADGEDGEDGLSGSNSSNGFPEGTPVLRVGTKCDIKRRSGCDLCVSSLTGEGLGALKEKLYELGFGVESDETYLMEERHVRALAEAQACVGAAERGAEEGLPSELYAEDLKRAYTALGVISGETATEEIIAEIFSNFCVGK